MKLSRVRSILSILAIILCLILSYQHLTFAQPHDQQLPQALDELLAGRTTDVISAASELKETDIPVALAVVELLKFKALHQETTLSSEQLNKFETLVNNRLTWKQSLDP